MESAPWHFRCPSFVLDETQGSLGDFMKKFPILTPFGFFCYLYLLAQAKGGVRDFWSATWTWKVLTLPPPTLTPLYDLDAYA